jgi:hydroxylamine reductase
MTAVEQMFCFQCEQAANGKGCTRLGVCGKNAEVAALQDELMEAVKGIGLYADAAAKLGARDRAIDVFVVQALFTTLTNVNFDPQRVQEFVSQAQAVAAKTKAMYEKAATAAGQTPQEMKVWHPDNGVPLILRRKKAQGDDLTSLQELLTYGLKGMASYADHAQILGQEDPAVYAYVHHALALLALGEASAADLTGEALKCGEVNIRAMELLDAANTGAYGHPEPTKVRITPVAGKCIVVSGHDLKDLYDLLVQTEGKGINVYTHGEMLPCLAYPGLKKFKHLVGNYGGAWQDQTKEFDALPGAILMTTNCIQIPRDTYKDRIFTSGVVACPGVTHIAAKADGSKDFTPVIEAALAQPGFTATEPEKTIMVGFARNAVLSVAGAVIDAVKAGKIRHFFLIGGCDGAKPGRNYYTDFAQAVPQDCVILTLACGKYRFNKLPFGDIGGIPRLLDVGQCNDSYSAVQIALALAKAFGVGVNDLPLSLVLSWYEQKACVILLSLLSLGIKNIRLGPTLPAFVTPNVLKVLVDNFNIMPTTTAKEDLHAILK